MMPQFDVHRFAGKRGSGIPYVVVVQSRRLDRLPTRAVIPLMRAAGSLDETSMAPRFRIAGEVVVLAPWQIFTMPADRLGPAVMSMEDDERSGRIIRAIDELITRGYG